MDAYYTLLERITDEQIANCIFYLRKIRLPDERIDKFRIKEDLGYTRGLDKYEFEINLLLKMDDDKFRTTLASSLDFTQYDSEARNLKEVIKYEVMNDAEAKKQAQVAERLSKTFQIIARQLRKNRTNDKLRKRKRLNQIEKTLLSFCE